jgi:hypothetical protein
MGARLQAGTLIGPPRWSINLPMTPMQWFHLCEFEELSDGSMRANRRDGNGQRAMVRPLLGENDQRFEGREGR